MRGGVGFGTFGPGGGYYGRGWRGAGYIGLPYYWPGYFGYSYSSYDGYFDGYRAGYAAPQYSYGGVQSTPVLIVNQWEPPYYNPPAGNVIPSTRGYRDERNAARDERADSPDTPYQPTIYKIAFQDHQIIPALAYWVKDGLLHYVTLDHALQEAPVQSVDRPRSEQINREQGVSFRLPAEKQ